MPSADSTQRYWQGDRWAIWAYRHSGRTIGVTCRVYDRDLRRTRWNNEILVLSLPGPHLGLVILAAIAALIFPDPVMVALAILTKA